jgi:hypothetical protein
MRAHPVNTAPEATLSFPLMNHAAVLVASLLLTGGAQADPQATSAPAAEVAGQPPDKPISQVTVEAQRASLEKRVFTYVSSVSHTTPRDEALRRWHVPICPLVAGLGKEKGEFILARLSQIAREAGAPLDKENCRANLAVIVTTTPDVLLKAWGDHRSAFGGPRDSPAAFNRFRSKQRPVRVWYNHDFGSPTSGPVLSGSLLLGPGITAPTGGADLLGSKMFVRDILVFSSVAVIVDGKRIPGLQIRQLADFIAIVALTEADLDAPLGTAPTILRLFEPHAAADPAPEGLTIWDRSFLKALYDTKLDLITQRSVITDKIMADLTP